jgi:phage baseplate assembly protein W
MASYDAGTLTNESKRSARIYKDLNLDFQQNTATKDIQKITDVESVKRSVRNLINTNHYEKPFRPQVGSNLRAMLFENISPQMNHAISKEIDLLIRNYEPRCRLVEVNTIPDFDRNAYSASISFYVVNHPEPVTVESFLERLR